MKLRRPKTRLRNDHNNQKKEKFKKSIQLIKLELGKKQIEMKLLHSQSLLTCRNLIEKMETQIGSPNKSFSDR